MQDVCITMDRISIQNSQNELQPTGCFIEQFEHHSAKQLNLVDVAIVWPEAPTITAQHRPSTRFLHFASHGIPLIFWPFQAYLDLADEGHYYLPDQTPPCANDSKQVAQVLAALAPAHVRMALRRNGLLLAANYSALGVAQKLVQLQAHRLSEI